MRRGGSRHLASRVAYWLKQIVAKPETTCYASTMGNRPGRPRVRIPLDSVVFSRPVQSPRPFKSTSGFSVGRARPAPSVVKALWLLPSTGVIQAETAADHAEYPVALVVQMRFSDETTASEDAAE